MWDWILSQGGEFSNSGNAAVSPPSPFFFSQNLIYLHILQKENHDFFLQEEHQVFEHIFLFTNRS